MHLLLFALVCLSFVSPALAQRPPALIPQSADSVVEVLPRGYPALTRAVPGPSRSNPLEEPARLLDAAARTGDARLAARADVILARGAQGGASVEWRKLQAFSAQHRHAFATSRQLLDSVIKDAPRDADARLARAQLNLVQGRMAQARRDCAGLAVMDAGRASICIAALATRNGEYAKAAGIVERFVSSGVQDPGFLRFALVMRGEIATRAGEPNAESWYERALALDPQDVRTLAAYARHLNGSKQAEKALALLAEAPDADGLQLQRALAARLAGRPDAARLAEGQARRYTLARSVGMEPELRDEAELRLTLRGDASAALALALRNFELQRDYEDVDILVRAARAANRTESLAGAEAWARREGLELPARSATP